MQGIEGDGGEFESSMLKQHPMCTGEVEPMRNDASPDQFNPGAFLVFVR